MNTTKRQKGHLFLTGFMGVGKSHFGQLLADQLQVTFFDTDREIEKREGLSISTIFKNRGEDYFRSKEKETLKSILRSLSSPSVISLGGGTFLNSVLLMQIKSQGLVVCLQRRNLHIPIQRGHVRPLLDRFNVYDLYWKRVLGYSAAHACLRVDLYTEEECISSLENLWEFHEMGT